MDKQDYSVESVTVGLAQVVDVQEDRILVKHAGTKEYLPCVVLERAARAPGLSPGDVVLVWMPVGGDEGGVIVGRVRATKTDTASEPQEVPDQLVLEAKHSLTLRVGDGSITIREDGKILIKGKDLVSHAQRLNRIKGGAVQIN